jgi:hypothetical protein
MTTTEQELQQLDIAMAEMMGLTREDIGENYNWCLQGSRIRPGNFRIGNLAAWSPATSPADAFQVVEWFTGQRDAHGRPKYIIEITSPIHGCGSFLWYVLIATPNTPLVVRALGATMPEAVCRAAKAAMANIVTPGCQK